MPMKSNGSYMLLMFVQPYMRIGKHFVRATTAFILKYEAMRQCASLSTTLRRNTRNK